VGSAGSFLHNGDGDAGTVGLVRRSNVCEHLHTRMTRAISEPRWDRSWALRLFQTGMHGACACLRAPEEKTVARLGVRQSHAGAKSQSSCFLLQSRGNLV